MVRAHRLNSVSLSGSGGAAAVAAGSSVTAGTTWAEQQSRSVWAPTPAAAPLLLTAFQRRRDTHWGDALLPPDRLCSPTSRISPRSSTPTSPPSPPPTSPPHPGTASTSAVWWSAPTWNTSPRHPPPIPPLPLPPPRRLLELSSRGDPV